VHDPHAADDLLQDLAGRLWSKFGTYDSQRPFVAWGLGFARLVAMEWRRKQSRLPLPLDEATLEKLADEAHDHADHYDARRDALHECLKSLTDHQRRTLHLRYHDELPVAQIASAWQRTEMAIYKVLKHTHRTLLDCMTQALAHCKG
jgi:RNA polymerase sigma-70 factor (ECF subfamily)